MGDEQRRAFAEFMGSTASAGQVFYSNPYPGGQMPTAPTPPPLVAPTPVAYPMPPRPPGGAEFIYLPRADPSPVQPALGDYSVNWPHTNANPPSPSEATASRPPMSSPPESGYRSERSREHHYEFEYTSREDIPTQKESLTAPLPILLCHVCKDCAQLRSARFHRQHPVVPGKPPVSSSCRRCAKKNKKRKERCVRKSVHVRTCTADEPCDWPAQDIHIQIGGDRGRSRHHRSHSVGVYIDPPGEHPQTVRRSESRTNLGLRVLQDIQPPRMLRPRSVSPVYIRVREEHLEADTRMAEHPMPYRVLPDQRSFSGGHEAPSFTPHRTSQSLYDHLQSSPGGILKRPDMKHQTPYRHGTTTRESQESTMVEIGGPKVQFSTDADRRAERIMLDRNREQSKQHILDRSDEDHDYFHRRETARYRTEGPRSPPGTRFEDLHIHPSSPPRGAYDEVRVRHISPRRFEELPARQESPERRYERIRIRHFTPPRGDVREVKVRYESPTPPRGEPPAHVSARRRSPQHRISPEIHYRYVPEPRRGRSPPREPSLEHPYSTYRTVERREIIERESSLPPIRKEKEKEKDWDQATATDSDVSGELVDVRTFRGTDENGQPATFVEERRRVRLIEGEKGDSERGGYPQERRGYEREKEKERYERNYEREYAMPGSYREV